MACEHTPVAQCPPSINEIFDLQLPSDNFTVCLND